MSLTEPPHGFIACTPSDAAYRAYITHLEAENERLNAALDEAAGVLERTYPEGVSWKYAPAAEWRKFFFRLKDGREAERVVTETGIWADPSSPLADAVLVRSDSDGLKEVYRAAREYAQMGGRTDANYQRLVDAIGRVERC